MVAVMRKNTWSRESTRAENPNCLWMVNGGPGFRLGIDGKVFDNGSTTEQWVLWALEAPEILF